MTSAVFFEKADEERYRRGWPHAVELASDHPDDRKPDASLKKLYKHFLGAYQGRWPREVAARFARVMSVSRTEWPVRFDLTPERKAAIDAGAPVDEALASRTLALHFAAGGRWAPDMQQHLLFVLEAFVGTDTLLRLLVGELERLPKAKWPAQDHDALLAVPYFAYLSGFLLLRASPDVATRERARLEALYEATVDEGIVGAEQTLRGGLDLGLHGVDGAKRVLAESHWQYLHWYGFAADLALLRERLNAGSKAEWNPDARLVYIGGAELLDDFAKPGVLRKTAQWRRAWLEHIGAFQHESVPRVMVENIDNKKAGTFPIDWIRAHEGYAVPLIQKLASEGGALATKAKSALSAIA